jgi:hypothetical protein
MTEIRIGVEFERAWELSQEPNPTSIEYVSLAPETALGSGAHIE